MRFLIYLDTGTIGIMGSYNSIPGTSPYHKAASEKPVQGRKEPRSNQNGYLGSNVLFLSAKSLRKTPAGFLFSFFLSQRHFPFFLFLSSDYFDLYITSRCQHNYEAAS